MNKIQKLSFYTVDEFLDFLPEHELLIVERLRELIFECLPEVTEKLSYNVPFFRRTKTICFIWPASIPWGKVPDKHVHLGFSKGNQLPDPFDILKSGTRKFVQVIPFSSLQEIDYDMVRFYLYEALELDK